LLLPRAHPELLHLNPKVLPKVNLSFDSCCVKLTSEL
jgi:hypothetical protein